ncbi:uncharacterized protein J3D65DRAFT_207755 [Phyllosticta citribraziliensis]|uniref:Life-span regulatory factor n=1 Tax=Phyllosticta citribraziliensis TaxID=989973 RepID=A0ABR1M3T8_9PEZI
MAAEWSHDFCLTCDRQIETGAYCSQACRLADLDKAADFTTNTSAPSSYASSTGGTPTGFYLSSPLNFKTSSARDSTPTSPSSASPRQQSYFSHASSHSTSSSSSSSSSSTLGENRLLTPSSSQSSLNSMAYPATQGLSAQAANELRSYAHAFDQVRDMRRRKQSA